MPGLYTSPNGDVGNPDSANVIGGHPEDSVGAGVGGATISGGGTSGLPNKVTGSFGTVGGDHSNTASVHSATVDGGGEQVSSGGLS